MLDRNAALFVAMCVIWGLTWVATKAGLETVPPFLFAATRFLCAGGAMAAFVLVRGERVRFAAAEGLQLLATSLLLVTIPYGLLLWGMLSVSSGTAALLNMASTPLALLAFALLFRQERFDVVRASAILLGVVGLAILFGPKADSGSGGVLASAAVVAAAVVYAGGSVLARPLIDRRGPAVVASVTMLLGGLMLLAGALATEPGARAALGGAWGWPAWAGWLFLVICSSLGGYTIFLTLLASWGASKAGSYAFVSPVIAVLAGMVVFGEQLSMAEVVGMAVMLVAAAIAVCTKPREPEAERVQPASPRPALAAAPCAKP